MGYAVEYDIRVQGDLKSIGAVAQKRIQAVIEAKLTSQPELFGKPLRRSLVGFRVLRVGNYRVVYLVKGSMVIVFLIGDRKHVYQEALKRLS